MQKYKKLCRKHKEEGGNTFFLYYFCIFALVKGLEIPQNWHHEHYDSVASTMLCCDFNKVSPGHFLLVTADEQTAGRGQRGNHWESCKGQNLTFNVAWRNIGIAANQQFLLSEVTAIAVVKALQAELDSSNIINKEWRNDVKIKWPNDIYVGDRKICGMLLEHTLCGKTIETSIAGIGINVNQHEFFSDAPNPVSLYQLLGKEIPRERVLENFVRHFSRGIELLKACDFDVVEQEFTTLLYRREGWHPYSDAGGEFLGHFVHIARNGTLTIEKEDHSLHDYAFKEIQYIIK